MKKLLNLSLVIVLWNSVLAQDPLFTQKTGNINHFNPALVGLQSNFGVQLNYRNQWPSFPNNPQTASLLTNYNFNNSLGVGLELKTDVIGILKKDNLKANVNYHKNFGNIETRYGLAAGVGQKKIDISNLRFEDQIDPGTGFVNPASEPFVNEPKVYATLDIGASAYYKGFMLIGAILQLNEPTVLSSGSQLSKRIVGSLAYMKEFDAIALAGMATFQHQNVSSILETQVFGQYRFVKLGLGYHQVFGSFSTTDFYSATVGIQFDKFSVGYSYDDDPFDTSTSNIVSRGTHQATAAWYIKGLSKEKGMSRLMNVLM